MGEHNQILHEKTCLIVSCTNYCRIISDPPKTIFEHPPSPPSAGEYNKAQPD